MGLFHLLSSFADQEADAVNLMARSDVVATLFSSTLLFSGDIKEWEASQTLLGMWQPPEGNDLTRGSLAVVLRKERRTSGRREMSVPFEPSLEL